MATTKDPPTSTSAFSDEQKSELSAMIADAVKGAAPPTADPKTPEAPKVSDAQWDGMSDRQRESFVRQIVDFRLGELAKDDEIAQLKAKVDGLGQGGTPKAEPEKAPDVVSRLRKFLWGAEPETAK